MLHALKPLHVSHCFCMQEKNQNIVLGNVTFMLQCTKEESGAKLVNPKIKGEKRNFNCAGYIFPLPNHFLRSFFLRFR